MGNPGRRAAAKLLPGLRSALEPDIVIANGENAAGGLGITKPTSEALFEAGIDVITLGNHSFAKRDTASYFDQEPRIVRPANYPPGVQGRGWGLYKTCKGETVAVTNLLGRVFMDAMDCPFRAADAVIEQASRETPNIIVDIHAEATSEKIALAWYLDGRVSAVLGTHTHVQTSDERVLPNGTAYITDAGMTGVHESVLGLDPKLVIERFMTRVPNKFVLAEGEGRLQGVVIDIDPGTGNATDIRRIVRGCSSEL